MRHHYSQFQKQVKKRLIPLAIAAIGGGVAPLWAQTADTLDTIVVTASRAQEAKREVSGNVTVITQNDIEASTASTVADIIVEQGFNVVTTGDTSNVQIRGFGNLSMTTEYENTVLILLNGRRTGTSNLAVMGLGNVERIEIVRGPSAVQYGSSALGGVINIITRRGKEGQSFLSAEAGIGSDHLTREKLAFAGAKNGFDFAFGATNYKRDDMTTSKFGRWHHSSVHDTMANLDLGYSLDKYNRVGISHNLGDIKSDLVATNGGIRGEAAAVWSAGYPSNDRDNPYRHYRKKTKNTALTYTGSTPDRNYEWSTTYSFGDYDQIYWDPGQPRFSGSRSHVDTRFFNAQGGYNGSLVSLSVGLDRYEYDIDAYDVESTMEDIGGYATGKLRLLDERLIFSAGVRHDRYTNKLKGDSSHKDRQTTGSVGVAFLPVEWLKLRANYAEGFKMPSPSQVAGDGAIYYSPNPGLKPEKSKTYEFGGDVSWRYVDASLTWFHSDWENKIIGLSYPGGVCSGGYGCYQYQNLKKAEIAGVESSLRVDLGKAFNKSWSLAPYASLTWLGTRKNKDPNQYFALWSDPANRNKKVLPNTPEWMASFGVDYAHPGYKIKSRINANHYGERYTNNYGATRPSGYFKKGGGTVTNLSLEKELVDLSGPSGTLTLRTEIINLFDTANEMYWGYPGPGRSFYVGLRYDY
ncbi:MAG: TonB-dependent receptor [Candidatus Accumulibacter sp.]|jgi:vitamin B12 transporter|nr:TonB-dependent receptor [Accumulibacter sp.]